MNFTLNIQIFKNLFLAVTSICMCSYSSCATISIPGPIGAADQKKHELRKKNYEALSMHSVCLFSIMTFNEVRTITLSGGIKCTFKGGYAHFNMHIFHF